ncbi:MAG: FHA domain-containing protein [Eubacteriales bacterium]|nr:FHA domain-containing protein [Eubacteriales bacterium]
MICPNCGAQMPDGGNFCTECGCSLTSAPNPYENASPEYSGFAGIPAGYGGIGPNPGGPAILKELALSTKYLVAVIGATAAIVFAIISAGSSPYARMQPLFQLLDDLSGYMDTYELEMYLYQYAERAGTANFFTILLSNLPAILTVTGLWLIFYEFKKKDRSSFSTTGFSILNVLMIIQIVVMIIISVVAVIGVFAVIFSIASYAGESESGAAIGLGIAAFLALFLALIIVYYFKCRRMIADSKRIMSEGTLLQTGSAYVGVFTMIGGILTLITAVGLPVILLLQTLCSGVSSICFSLLIFSLREKTNTAAKHPVLTPGIEPVIYGTSGNPVRPASSDRYSNEGINVDHYSASENRGYIPDSVQYSSYSGEGTVLEAGPIPADRISDSMQYSSYNGEGTIVGNSAFPSGTGTAFNPFNGENTIVESQLGIYGSDIGMRDQGNPTWIEDNPSIYDASDNQKNGLLKEQQENPFKDREKPVLPQDLAGLMNSSGAEDRSTPNQKGKINEKESSNPDPSSGMEEVYGVDIQPTNYSEEQDQKRSGRVQGSLIRVMEARRMQEQEEAERRSREQREREEAERLAREQREREEAERRAREEVVNLQPVGLTAESLNHSSWRKEDYPYQTEVLDPSMQKQPMATLFRKKDHTKVLIQTSTLCIGRNPREVDYLINDNPAIGRHHADIVQRDGKYYIVDRASRNGVYVNGIMIPPYQEIEIKDQTEIRLADEEFFFTIR